MREKDGFQASLRRHARFCIEQKTIQKLGFRNLRFTHYRVFRFRNSLDSETTARPDSPTSRFRNCMLGVRLG